jgi:hypothetical protein
VDDEQRICCHPHSTFICYELKRFEQRGMNANVLLTKLHSVNNAIETAADSFLYKIVISFYHVIRVSSKHCEDNLFSKDRTSLPMVSDNVTSS